MKNLLLVIGLSLSLSVMAQEIDKPYEFPVKPGSEQWAKLNSSIQKDEVCIIPDAVLNGLSTKALLITCLNYPRIVDFFLASDMQSGFNFYSKHFKGLAELLKRSDLNNVLLQSYLNLDISTLKLLGYDLKLSLTQVAFLELLISQESIIGSYEKNEKLTLISEAIKKLEQRQKLGKSLFRQRTSALILSRILYSEDVKMSEFDNYGNDIFSVFNSQVVIIDKSVVDKVLIVAKKFLEN